MYADGAALNATDVINAAAADGSLQGSSNQGKKKKKKKVGAAGKNKRFNIEVDKGNDATEQPITESADQAPDESHRSSHSENRRFFEEQMMRATGSKMATSSLPQSHERSSGDKPNLNDSAA